MKAEDIFDGSTLSKAEIIAAIELFIEKEENIIKNKSSIPSEAVWVRSVNAFLRMCHYGVLEFLKECGRNISMQDYFTDITMCTQGLEDWALSPEGNYRDKKHLQPLKDLLNAIKST
jgi:hypothetical protein